jgi:hypothetical protein
VQLTFHVNPRDFLAGKNLESRAIKARNDAKNSGYYEMPTVVCFCVGPREKNSLSYTKARRLS